MNELRQMIDRFGVMAVIKGVVANNTHRRLDVNEFRGFALADRYAPLIFVSGADAKSAQMFTLAHIWLGEGGLSGFEKLLLGGTNVEEWCNQAAAEFLVPSRELRECWKWARSEQKPFEAIGRSFKVSPVVAARRALGLKLVNRRNFFEFYEIYVARETQKRRTTPGGVDFYNNQNLRVGKLFATHVMSAAVQGKIGFGEAYELTDLGGGTIHDYAERLGIRLS